MQMQHRHDENRRADRARGERRPAELWQLRRLEHRDTTPERGDDGERCQAIATGRLDLEH